MIREAKLSDITKMQVIRNLVKENVLSDPKLIKDEDYADFIETRGKGWVFEEHKTIKGFAIVDVVENNVWALFVHPDCEQKGIGQKLHSTMMNWYFGLTHSTIWLSTEKNTKAQKFYEKHGWLAVGDYGKTEVKFEMSFEQYQKAMLRKVT